MVQGLRIYKITYSRFVVNVDNIWIWGWLILCLKSQWITEQSLPSSTPRPPLQPSVLHSGCVDSPSWLPLSAPASTRAPGTSCECAGMSSRPYWNERHPTRFSLKWQNWRSFSWGYRQRQISIYLWACVSRTICSSLSLLLLSVRAVLNESWTKASLFFRACSLKQDKNAKQDCKMSWNRRRKIVSGY